jgi:hypothetical protein
MWDKAKWDELSKSWEEAGPPATPSKQDIQNFSLLMSKYIRPDSRILLLGSTPSLRLMMANEYESCEVVCVDFSNEMYRRTSELITLKNPRESVVFGNWLDFNLGALGFSVALGDKIIDNIAPKDWRPLFENIHRHLEDEGCLIVHMAIADSSFKTVTVDSALEKWSKTFEAGQIDLNTTVAGFWEDLLTASAFADGNYYNTVTIDRFRSDLERVYGTLDDQPFSSPRRQILKVFKDMFASSWHSEWSSYQLEDIRNETIDLFELDSLVYSTDYEAAKCQPIGRFVKRSSGNFEA